MLGNFMMIAGFVLLVSVSARAEDNVKEMTLSKETQELIAAYQQNPTEEIEDALLKRVEMSYDRMLVRKKTELLQLKEESKDAAEIQKAQKAFDNMVAEKENKVWQTMKRLSKQKLPSIKHEAENYLPISESNKKVFIAYAPVTNKEYAVFVNKTKGTPPITWNKGKIPEGKDNHPVTGISYKDAEAYCQWLTKQDGKHKYRLPSEAEWELAAGKNPEDADINCALNKGTTPIDAFAETTAASGAVDMWGNVWEWTSTSKSTVRGLVLMSVKGGSWASPRARCRTEYRGEAREPRFADNTLGFRVVREN